MEKDRNLKCLHCNGQDFEVEGIYSWNSEKERSERIVFGYDPYGFAKQINSHKCKNCNAVYLFTEN